jgi:serine/threonine-protein kinase
LTDVLGHGAMAMVYRAHDEILDREVAIKVMNATVAARAEGAERMRREALAVASTRHPHIVQVHDFVANDPAVGAYLVQELINGPTLADVIERAGGRLVPEVAAMIVASIAEALAAAHGRGVVHRDVKPANVMFDRGREGTRVVLTDFGVAHISDMTTMTATGALVGSPAYMAPEQARSQDVGPASDIWALGVMLYQMATGHMPFPGREPLAVIVAIAQGQFARAAQIQARVSPELDRIISTCLAREPRDRFATAGAMAAALRELLDDTPLPDASETLNALLDGPAALTTRLGPALADHAVRKARQCLSQRQTARALAQIGRAAAHVPGHADAEALLAKISAGRKWTQAVLVAAAALAVAGGGVGAWRWAATGPTDRVAPSRSASPLPMEPAPDPATIAVPASTPPTRVEPGAIAASPGAMPSLAVTSKENRSGLEVPGKTARRNAAKRVRRTDAPQSGTTTTAGAGETTPVTDDTGSTRAAEPASPIAEAAPPAKMPLVPAVVRLFSARAFCYPSLDDHAPSQVNPEYRGVSPGPHRVYCSPSAAGPKILVGIIDVLPGAVMEKQIRQSSAGRPVFSPGP